MLYATGPDFSQEIYVILASSIVAIVAMRKGACDEKRKYATLAVGTAALIVAALSFSVHHFFNWPISIHTIDPAGYITNRHELRAAIDGLNLLYILSISLIMLWSFYLIIKRVRLFHNCNGRLVVAAGLSSLIIPIILALLGTVGFGICSTYMAFPFISQGAPTAISLFLIGITLGTISDGQVVYD